MIEKYSYYEYKICKGIDNTFTYQIFSEGYLPYDDGVIESDEYFDTEQEARFAVIGHITKLENGE